MSEYIENYQRKIQDVNEKIWDLEDEIDTLAGEKVGLEMYRDELKQELKQAIEDNKPDPPPPEKQQKPEPPHPRVLAASKINTKIENFILQ